MENIVMESSNTKDLKRQHQIAHGQFSLLKKEDSPEFNNLVKHVQFDESFINSALEHQIEEAFRFNDSEMLNELSHFLLGNLEEPAA